MNVPLLDLGPQTRALREDILAAVTEVIDSTSYILGPRVSAFEDEIAAYCQAGFGIGVSSGTDALVMTLMALEIGPGDRVVTTPYTFFATMGAILRVGAEPVFVDIDEDSFNMDPAALEKTLEQIAGKGGSVRAIMPVHLFGQCADMDAIMRIARRFSVPVVEDAAQAIGACCPVTDTQGTVTWRKAGSMGIAGCFSFFPSKNLGGIGDGGLVTTSDPEFDKVLRSCRNHGASPKYYHPRVGGNFRLDPIQAVVLSIKLKHLDSWHGQRRANSLAYHEAFAAYNLVGNPVRLPKEMFAGTSGSDGEFHHIYNQFVIRVPRRDALKTHLLEKGIGCEIYYPCCLHQQQCVQKYNDQSFPVAEQAARESLALPIYPDLSSGQIDQVVAAIADFYTST